MKRLGISDAMFILVVLVIISMIVSLTVGIYSLGERAQVNQLQSKLTGDESQITNLSSQVASLQNQVISQTSSLQSIANSQQSQSGDLNQLSTSLSSIQSTLQNLQSQVQALTSSSQANADQLQQMQSSVQNELQQLQESIQNVNASIITVQADIKNLQPQEPFSTLMITQSSFDNATKTESFTVKNTWNGMVNAQLQVYVQCITRPGAIWNCPNPVGTYTSNIMQFSPDSTTVVSFNLSQVNVLSSGTMDQLQLYLVSSSTTVSPTYTLQYP